MSSADLTAVRLQLDDSSWLRLLEDCDEAVPFHHPNWARMIGECYGFTPFAVGVVADGRLLGGVPVVEARGLVRQRRWLSLPYTDYCPPLLPSAGSGAAAVIDVARRQAGIRRLELHGELAGASQSETVGLRHVLPLQRDAELVFATFGKSQVRRGIRKAQSSGELAVRVADCETDVTELFYALQVETRRRLGVPVQPKRFFRHLWRDVLEPGLGYALLAYADGRPIAGMVFLAWKRTVVYKFGASLQRFQRLRPNHLLLWRAIEDACHDGYEVFDFGRTDFENEGLRSFKLGWGTTEKPLVYSTLSDARQPASARRVTPGFGPLLRRSPAWVCRATGELLYKYAA